MAGALSQAGELSETWEEEDGCALTCSEPGVVSRGIFKRSLVVVLGWGRFLGPRDL